MKVGSFRSLGDLGWRLSSNRLSWKPIWASTLPGGPHESGMSHPVQAAKDPGWELMGAEGFREGEGRGIMTHDSQIHRGARHQVSGPRRGGRGLRKPAGTALWGVVRAGPAPMDADAPLPHQATAERQWCQRDSWGRGGRCQPAWRTRSPCAGLQIPPQSPWPGGGRKLRSCGGRWPCWGQVTWRSQAAWGAGEQGGGVWSPEEAGLAAWG